MSFSSRLFSPSESTSPRKLAGPSAQSGGILLFIGGYLGAGKTTLLRELAERLRGRGLKVGLVANDQGAGLVDKVRMQNEEGGTNRTVVEISGGCFCCKSDGLAADLHRMLETAQPDVILAEPVGGVHGCPKFPSFFRSAMPLEMRRLLAVRS